MPLQKIGFLLSISSKRNLVRHYQILFISNFIGYATAKAANNPPHQSATNHAHCFALGCASNHLIHMFMARFTSEYVITVAGIGEDKR